MFDINTLTDQELHQLQADIRRELKKRQRKLAPVVKNTGEPKRKWTLYVLMLEKGKYYVGITSKHPNKRYAEHELGIGAKWTRKYKPLGIVETIKLGTLTESHAVKYETDKTLLLMQEHGKDAVRGGSLSYVADQRIEQLYERIKEKADKSRQEYSDAEILAQIQANVNF